MINNIIKTYHDEMAHCGLEKTFEGIFSTYWFPSMRKRIRDYIDNCLICVMANSSSNVREGEMQVLQMPTEPFRIVHADHFGHCSRRTMVIDTS